MSETPAQRVIRILGGPSAVAEILNVHPTRVFEWKRDRGKSGVTGRIPTQHQQPLLDHAREHKLSLTADDFFDAPADTPVETAAPSEAA